MEIETLKDRINKCKDRINKIERRIKKWTDCQNEKDFEKKDGWLLAFGRDRNYLYQEYLKECNNELDRAINDLHHEQLTLEKYQNMLKVEEAKASAAKVDVIWNFLLNYKDKIRKYLNDNTKWKHEYYQLNSKYCDMYNSRKYSQEQLNDVRKQEKEAHKNVHLYVDRYYNTRKGWDEEAIEKQLTKDITNKYYKLIDKVTKYTGEIIDASGLYIQVGDLNGIIIGKSGKAHIQTIGAGGYAIQCFHYRELVHPVKEDN